MRKISKPNIILILTGYLLLSVSIWVTPSHAADCNAKFSWLPNPESDLAGYSIYYGQTDGGPYPNEVDIGNPTLVDGRVYGEVVGLACGEQYYFVCVAYTTQGEKSDYSSQVGYLLVEGDLATKIFGDTADSDYLGTIQDTFINVNDENNVNSTVLNTYTWPENMVANAILLKLDLSGLPVNSQVQTATLQLYLTGSGGDAAYEISVHKIINHNPELSLANGFSYNGSGGWTANDQCYNGVPLAQADIATSEDVNSVDQSIGYKNWNITQMVKDWVANPSTNFGVLLNSDPVASTSSHRYFASTDALETTQRPKIIVTYSVAEQTLQPPQNFGLK